MDPLVAQGPRVAGVTVGIPLHFASKVEHVRAAINSVIEQTYPPTAIHLILDGPISDEVLDLVDEYLAGYNYMKKIILTKNMGLPTALNISILSCFTPYYARMDSDDICHPNRLARQVEYLEMHPGIGIIGSWAIEFRDRHDAPGLFLKKLPLEHREICRFFHFRDPFVHSSVLFRHEIFATIGLYDTRFITDQDTELWSRALQRGVGLANIPEALIYFRVGNMLEKRSSFPGVVRQLRARYSYNTCSPRLNVLKFGSVMFRFLPRRFRALCYKKLR